MKIKRSPRYLGSITLRCGQCGKKFTRDISVHKHVVKDGAKVFFCNYICAGRYKIRFCFKDRSKWKKTGTKLDELSPFRSTIKKCKMRKKWKTDVDALYIKKIWEQQRGKCALSNIKMLPLRPKATGTFIYGPRHPLKPSLDRIDPLRGYVKGNVRWVCLLVNLALADFPQSFFIKVC